MSFETARVYISNLSSCRDLLALGLYLALVATLGGLVWAGAQKTHEKLTSPYTYMGWTVGRVPGTPGVGLPFAGSELAQQAARSIESLPIERRALVVVVLPEDAGSELVAHIATKLRFLSFPRRIRSVRSSALPDLQSGLTDGGFEISALLFAPGVSTVPEKARHLRSLPDWRVLYPDSSGKLPVGGQL